MSSDKQKSSELNNIELCYKALGLSLDASPPEVEKAYKSVTDKLRAEMSAANPTVREDARNSLELISELYENIKNSVTYKSMVREYEQRAARLKADARRPGVGTDARVTKANLKNCPSCNAAIRIDLKVCPVCKGWAGSTSELVLQKLSSPKSLAIVVALIFICVCGMMIFFFQNELVGLIDDLRGVKQDVNLK